MSASRSKTIDYLEIPSRDIRASQEFFTEMLGWTFTDHGSDYSAFEDGRISGGFYKSERISLSSEGGCLPIIYTPQLEDSRADAIRLGATITRDIFSFPGGRRFQFTEPGGSEFAIWSDAT